MNHFFSKNLINATARISTANASGKYKLDKNEQSLDVEIQQKIKVLENLMHSDWHRYPSADLTDIEEKVAQYCGLQANNIVLGAGSASIITTLLNYLAINGKKLVITHPSYSLFEYHCNTYQIPFTPWLLNQNLEFDLSKLPQLDHNSVLIVTSPNNPTGNAITKVQLETILKSHPETMVILDGVYTEFGQEDFTSLILSYNNLVVIRSFSKAFPMAGLRLGYLCSNEKMAAIVKKLMLPFSINALTLSFAREILFTASFMMESKKRVLSIISEREKMKAAIKAMECFQKFTLYNSEGNFILLRLHDEKDHALLLDELKHSGIRVLNTTNFTLLQNTIRVSIGTAEENMLFLDCLSSCFVKSDCPVYPLLYPVSPTLTSKLESIHYN